MFGKLKHTLSIPKNANPKDIEMYPIMTGLLSVSVMHSLNLDVISQSLQKDYTISLLLSK
ncbi:MAG: hypothetical protein CMB10_03775 [Euryarchaeota archaeon]|nr:hypothetical protein [Euryarchaeota archaeon]